MNNDVAIFLDLDNVVIGSIEAKIKFDVNLVVEKIRSMTDGRIVMRRAYGDWRQRANMTKELASAGFDLQSTVRLSSNSKNLADMQMVVDALGTLIDGHVFRTYVLITGDRDFAPLVQELRKRGKHVIGSGVNHTTSRRLAALCDQFIFYDDLVQESHHLQEDQVSDLLERALDQLLQDKSRVPASLLKQRMQALSRGSFARSRQGKASFRKMLAEYPQIARVQQEGTTIYIQRPDDNLPPQPDMARAARKMSSDEIEKLLKQALDESLQDQDQVRASLLKQRMQALSNGEFDETLQGDKNFRKFLDRFQHQIRIDQEGSTIYVCQSDTPGDTKPAVSVSGLSTDEASALLQQSLDELLVDQSRVRASLLKQRMQESSNGVFDESQHGAENFRHFLERHPALVKIHQRGTTLLVERPTESAPSDEFHLFYRSELKKRGIRVVPSAVRLQVLKDLIASLQLQPQSSWRDLVNHLSTHYQNNGREDISKSYINDVLRVARRAGVLSVKNSGSLTTAPVLLKLSGERIFQEAVLQCDATYLRELQKLENPFDLEQASIALYESTSHVRYLQVVLTRFTNDD
jgi:hypothetical protein